MPYSVEALFGNVAQIQHSSHEAFGSGWLIGRNLVLTARHVVIPEGAAAPVEHGWRVRLVAGRPDVQKWTWIDASIAWVGQDTLDLALLELHPGEGAPDWDPTLKLRIGRIEAVQHHRVRALGFPRGAKVDDKRTLFAPSGDLDEEKGATLSFGVDQQYQPDSPRDDWRGFSGAAVLLAESSYPEVVWIYGVVQQVPQSFTRRLAVARLAKPWDDNRFRELLQSARISLETPADPLVCHGLTYELLQSFTANIIPDQLSLVSQGRYIAETYVHRDVDDQLAAFSAFHTTLRADGSRILSHLSDICTDFTLPTIAYDHITSMATAIQRNHESTQQWSALADLKRSLHYDEIADIVRSINLVIDSTDARFALNGTTAIYTRLRQLHLLRHISFAELRDLLSTSRYSVRTRGGDRGVSYSEIMRLLPSRPLDDNSVILANDLLSELGACRCCL
jgi:hypothetical protein